MIISFTRMILPKPIHRTFYHASHRETLGAGGFGKLGGEMTGDAAHGTDGKVGAAVLHDVAAEELTEIVDDDGTDGRHGEMAVDERSERGKKTVGQRLAINTADDIGHSQTGFTLKVRQHGGGQTAFIHCVDEKAAKHGTAALVAKDVAKRRSVHHDMASVVKT